VETLNPARQTTNILCSNFSASRKASVEAATPSSCRWKNQALAFSHSLGRKQPLADGCGVRKELFAASAIDLFKHTSSDVKTASFFSYTGLGRISIARFAPRGLAAGYRVYRALAPGPWSNSVPYERYLELYNTQLAALDPEQVWNDLHLLVSLHEPVLYAGSAHL
jgi:hypothetical protein